MALLPLWIFPQKVLPIGYGIPLILLAWVRRRALLWFAVAAFTVITAVKFFVILPPRAGDSLTGGMIPLDFALVQLDLFVIVGAVHALIVARERIEQRNVELKRNNARLASANRELGKREEEVARQNEELQSQTEELERQTEEIRVTNEELTRRERVTEALLSLSRTLTVELTRDEMMARICEVLAQLADGGTAGTAILEQDGNDALAVRCHHGFGADGLRDDTLPAGRSFSSLVLSRGRTAYIEDLGQRPDLVIPQPQHGDPFVAVLSAPLRAMGWPIGTLEVYRKTPGPWDDEDVSLIDSLAAQTSISLEALRRLEEVSQERRRYESVLRTAPVGIAVINVDGTDLRLNSAGAAMFGVPSDANVAQDNALTSLLAFHEGRPVAPDQWPQRRAARDGVDVYGEELEVVLVSGVRISLLINSTPFRDATGKPNGAVVVFVNITTLKELQREIDTRRREAEEASVRKTRFLAAVSHDIRTPANAITLLAELIRRTATNPALAGEVPDLAKELHASALSLVDLLGDVLDLARYDSGRLEIQESEFSLADLLNEEYRRYAPTAREKGLALKIVPPPQPLRVRTDRIKLSRVIGNLVGNAIKFTAAGEVSIEAGRDDGDAAPLIRIHDSGIGIDPEHQHNIFDEFVQLNNRERDRNKGTGLGLTICKRLVDAMGGRLSLESRPGSGSTFTVALPPTAVVP